MKKGKNTFAKWQEAAQSARETLIRGYLEYLVKTRVRTQYVTDLAELVAGHISEVEGRSCSRSTLLRNKRYAMLLHSYMAANMQRGVKRRGGGREPEPASAVAVLAADLSANNLKRELDRLKVYVETLESQLDHRPAVGVDRRALPASESMRSGRLDDHELRFVVTCQALRALVAHLNLVISVDTSAMRILDSSKRRNNVIVDTELARPFIEWLTQQSNGQA